MDNTHPQAATRGLALVIPKRHARRSVTRQLIRRQARAVVLEKNLAQGDWLIRLRSPFDRRQFPSAASDSLRAAVRAELWQLIGAVARA